MTRNVKFLTFSIIIIVVGVYSATRLLLRIKFSPTKYINADCAAASSSGVPLPARSSAPMTSLEQCDHIPSFEAAVVRQFRHILSKDANFTKRRRSTEPPATFNQAMKELRQNATHRKYDVRVSNACIRNNLPFLKLVIREFPGVKAASSGGSGLMVRSHSAYLNVCPVLDHFNGTYTVYCPMYSSCANISVLLKHIDFSGFNGRTDVIERYVWKEDNVCIKKHVSSSSMSSSSLLQRFSGIATQDREMMDIVKHLPKPQTQLLNETGVWFQHKQSWHWIDDSGLLLPPVSNKTLCDCYQKFHKVYFVGASHQGINFHCMKHLCQGSNLITMFLTGVKAMIDPLTKTFHDIQTDPDSNHRYAFTIQFGSWGTNVYSSHEIIFTLIPRFQRLLREIYVAPGLSRRMRLLVMSAPSTPDQEVNGSRILNRNNWILAVFAQVLGDSMAEIGVEYLDEFGFTFPVYWNTNSWPDINHHYSRWIAKTKTCRGRVGKAFSALFTYKLCPETRPAP